MSLFLTLPGPAFFWVTNSRGGITSFLKSAHCLSFDLTLRLLCHLRFLCDQKPYWARPEMSFADFGRTYFNLDFSAFHISALEQFVLKYFCLYIVSPELSFAAHISVSHCFVLTQFSLDSVLLHLLQSHTLQVRHSTILI